MDEKTYKRLAPKLMAEHIYSLDAEWEKLGRKKDMIEVDGDDWEILLGYAATVIANFPTNAVAG